MADGAIVIRTGFAKRINRSILIILHLDEVSTLFTICHNIYLLQRVQ